MFMFNLARSRRLMILLAMGLSMLAASNATAAERPALGVAPAAHTLAELDLTVLPDGSGLPAGAGDVATGAVVYARQCLACHGERGAGGSNDMLVGGRGSLATQTPIKTLGSYWPYATTIFDYVRRAMPYQAPGTLSSDEVYAVTAYLLHLNGIVAADARLDAATLPRVVMPNRDNFVWAYPAPPPGG